MIENPTEFLNLFNNSGKESVWRIGTIDSNYISGRPKIKFDGELSASSKSYRCLSSYTPAPNDKVLLLKVAGSYVVLGSVDGQTSGQVPQGSGVQAYTFYQNSVANVWTIDHNLNRLPSVTVVDSAASVVIGDVKYINPNSLTITFSAPFTGAAYLI